MIHLAKNIELWTVDRLKPYERNARTHSPEQVTKIAASMTEFGFTNPILVDSKDGIIAGHGRLMAARELGLVEVPVIVLDHLSDAQRRAYILADNRLALDAGWDEEILALEFSQLQHDDFNLDLTGFDNSEIDKILDFSEEDEGFEPNIPSNDREPIRNMTFTVSDEQHELIEAMLKAAKQFEPQDPMGINENSNGNALWYICETFKTVKGVE